jgi:hypothetical protein
MICSSPPSPPLARETRETERGSRRRANYVGEAPQERRVHITTPFDTALIIVYRYPLNKRVLTNAIR